MSSVVGKVALITGGAQGLGKAYCEALLERGANVCVADANDEKGETTVREFEEKHGSGKATFIKCDVTSQQDMEKAFSVTQSVFGGVDIVCNNAGISDETQWERVIAINLTGVVRGTLLGIENMSKEKGGKGGIIVNVSSITGLGTTHILPAYCAAKNGVLAYTRSWAKNPSCERMGIRFHTICPSFAQTAIMNPSGGTVYDQETAKGLVETAGIMRPETVADAFIKLVEREDTTGAVVSVSKREGLKWVEDETPIEW